MRELNVHEIEKVSGGSLTSLILDFFKSINSSSKEKNREWTRPESIPSANPVSGEAFGRGIIGIIAAITFGLLVF